MKRRGGSQPTTLGALLTALSARPGWQRKLEGAQVHLRWTEIVGEQLAAHAQPVRLAGGVLVVRAKSALWAAEVQTLSGLLAERANDVLGCEQVSRVHVVNAELDGPSDW